MADTDQETQESPPQGETTDTVNESTSEAAGTDAEPSGGAATE